MSHPASISPLGHQAGFPFNQAVHHPAAIAYTRKVEAKEEKIPPGMCLLIFAYRP
jgi:hypothetical protein